MINQRGILRVPDFALPRTSTRASHKLDYRLYDSLVADSIREEIPVFYKKLAVCVFAIAFGTGIGVITPIVTQALGHWQYF